jgi:geranyl-CoA carboxylase beta subunit
MPPIVSRLNPASETFARNRDAMLASVDRLRAIEARARTRSEASKPAFEKRGALLPRERIGRLLDLGSPWFELSALGGYGLDTDDKAKSVPNAGMIVGIGYVSGVRCMIVASESGINAGAIGARGVEKLSRAQDLSRANKLPFVYLVESAGANLLEYTVEGFVNGGAIFRNLARLSAAGVPVVTVVHGSSTAGGAYFPGLSDYVIVVRGRARAFLAGPPLLKAATGEIATEEELGGADMHARVTGLAEYVAENDADALRIARDVVSRLDWGRVAAPSGPAPRYRENELLGVMPADPKRAVDMREAIARIVDDSDFLEFKADYGPATVVGHASIEGIRIGIVTNNGPLDPDGATKATHFIHACCQADVPILYMQNTTGYIVGTASERAGMIKHGSKMIQAVTMASVPQITLMCGASFGAGNYGMCGRGFDPDFLFSWPNAQTAVMGAQQAASVMATVTEEGAKRRGTPIDPAQTEALRARIVATFERQMSAFDVSGELLDDGVIDPRDTRRVLSLALSIVLEARERRVVPMQFGVARP